MDDFNPSRGFVFALGLAIPIWAVIVLAVVLGW